jgi:hypothetical protein
MLSVVCCMSHGCCKRPCIVMEHARLTGACIHPSMLTALPLSIRAADFCLWTFVSFSISNTQEGCPPQCSLSTAGNW